MKKNLKMPKEELVEVVCTKTGGAQSLKTSCLGRKNTKREVGETAVFAEKNEVVVVEVKKKRRRLTRGWMM
jgi:hypothetical protein